MKRALIRQQRERERKKKRKIKERQILDKAHLFRRGSLMMRTVQEQQDVWRVSAASDWRS